MKLIAIMPARNEDWIIGLSGRVALRWCDELVVLDHASTDRTGIILREIADEHPGRVTILEEPDACWAEMSHRQRLLDAARIRGATHVALVDADEVVTANVLRAVREATEDLLPGQVLRTPMRAMWRDPHHYRIDPANVFSNATIALSFADRPGLCWQTQDGYDFHHREPYGSKTGPLMARGGGVMHLQFADWPRIVAKHALYKATEMIRWPSRRPPRLVEAQYNFTLNEHGLITERAPASWWEGYPVEHLHIGAEPWQAAEVRRLWREHGPEKFAGLDLFGVEKEVECLSA